MDTMLRAIGINTYWGAYSPFADGNGGTSAFLMVAAMCLIGTTIINGVLKFDSLFNTIVNFSALFAGAYVANLLAYNYHLPGVEGLVMIAIAANAGMAFSSILLMIYYRTSFN